MYFDSNRFYWATGIEDTFITATHESTGRSLDEYELTDHYRRWSEDLGLIREIGIRHARYGIPWHIIQPQRNTWNWDWPDQVLTRMFDLGINPILDLIHYGLPSWIEGAYLNPDYPSLIAEYAHKVASRYKGRVTWYTPFNEPRIGAWYCGKIGWWPPFYRGWNGFLKVLLQICKGIIETEKALKACDPNNVIVAVDATDLYFSKDPNMENQVRLRQEIVFLALDLMHSKVQERHPLWSWLLKNHISENEISWFEGKTTRPDILGINMYPMFTQKELFERSGRVRYAMRYAGGEMVDQLCQMYWQRYKTPLMITETASVGSVRRRLRWLDESIAAVKKIRQQEMPLVGYTWWPLFSLVGWGYRQGKHPMSRYMLHMGLWDLDSNLDRNRTEVADRFREYASANISELETHV